jgi:hypothetical protein
VHRAVNEVARTSWKFIEHCMDAIKNPFSPGAGSPPPELVGRAGNRFAGSIVLFENIHHAECMRQALFNTYPCLAAIRELETGLYQKAA